jgi:hypothetical protein
MIKLSFESVLKYNIPTEKQEKHLIEGCLQTEHTCVTSTQINICNIFCSPGALYCFLTSLPSHFLPQRDPAPWLTTPKLYIKREESCVLLCDYKKCLWDSPTELGLLVVFPS